LSDRHCCTGGQGWITPASSRSVNGNITVAVVLAGSLRGRLVGCLAHGTLHLRAWADAVCGCCGFSSRDAETMAFSSHCLGGHTRLIARQESDRARFPRLGVGDEGRRRRVALPVPDVEVNDAQVLDETRGNDRAAPLVVGMPLRVPMGAGCQRSGPSNRETAAWQGGLAWGAIAGITTAGVLRA